MLKFKQSNGDNEFSTPNTHLNSISGFEELPFKKQFQRKYRSLKIKCSHEKKFVSRYLDPSEISAIEINIHIEKLSNLQLEYDELVDILVELEEETEYEEYSEDLEKINDEIITVKSELISLSSLNDKFTDMKPNKILNRKKSHDDDEYDDVKPFRTQRPKLPSIPIPAFSGNPGEWIHFKNTFMALVHNDSGLSGVVKFSYLLDSLNDETKLLLGTITLTDDGYNCAWNALLERFDNKRKIIDHHIDELLNLPNVTKDNDKDLRTLINKCISNISALEFCGHSMDKLSEQFLINIVMKKLNLNLRKDWEEEISSTEPPTWSQLLEFLKKKCRILETIDSSKTQLPFKKNAFDKSKSKPFSKNPMSNSHSFLNTSNKPQEKRFNSAAKKTNVERCQLCNKGEHFLFHCPQFLGLSSHERYNKAKDCSLCINCLKSNKHSPRDCLSSRCKACGNLHHTLLHHVQPDTPEKSNIARTLSAPCANETTIKKVDQAIPSTSKAVNNFYAFDKNPPMQVLLPTAIIMIKDNRGKFHECRALLDSGSQANFITASLADKLHLTLTSSQRTISCLNDNSTPVNSQTTTTIKSKNNQFEQNVNLLVVPTISNSIPSYPFDISMWDIPRNISLADPQFNLRRPIDVLLGSQLFFHVLRQNKLKIGDNRPAFYETTFGWIATGSHELNSLNFSISDQLNKDDELQNSLKKFFDLDPVSEKIILSTEEQLCEDIYCKTTHRDSNGRYVVTLPLNENIIKMGESKKQAQSRLLYLERKLDNNPDFKKQYSEVINEYKTLHHMEKIDDSNDPPELIKIYLPHHAVVKPSSTTTKVRVVFDASAKSTTNVSLNDSMLIGPTVQQSCNDIALRFRVHKYVFTSDINKMYRQIKVDKSQTPLQRILWRDNKNDPIEVFELNTVTFGTASAPYLATRTIKQLAIDEQEKYPKASSVAQRDFYVDDCLSGSNDLMESIEIVSQLQQMLSSAGFQLRKWCSNNLQIIEQIPIRDRELISSSDTPSIECIKTLGISWNPTEDTFLFSIPPIVTEGVVTKRLILSQIAKLYDPLGLISPAIITAKILLQRLWKIKSGWDDPVPPDILEIWHDFHTSLPSLNDIRIDRHIFSSNPSVIELHGFADSSEQAYGACFYARSIDDSGNITVKLICSKSRVAPLNSTSLPRLELCAALLLSRLLKTVVTALNIEFQKIYLWSDSTIALSWIRTEPYKLKTFVSNRVTEIQELTKNSIWKHVRTENNPADIVSRGILPNQLTSNHSWFHGPQFLYLNSSFEETFDYCKNEFDPKTFELKPNSVTMVATSDNSDTTSEVNDIINRYSSYKRLIRISAYCLRFMKNCKLKKSERQYGCLTNDELEYAITGLVLAVQREAFPKDIALLSKNHALPPKSPLLSLNPFLDSTNVLRVGGRLNNADLSYDRKHQMLLPTNHHFTKIMFRHYHVKNLHAGPNLLLSFVRQKFWPLSAKNIAKQCVRSCVPCFRVKPCLANQIMGDLPSERLNPAPPFYTTGIDYCGPFYIKNKRARNSPKYKVYVAVFVCFTTKCLHLDIVPDLTSKEFINCLKRFISRRGKPHTLWSDNATTFIGAKNELKELLEFFRNDASVAKIIDFCNTEEINWKFIPPRSPNFGGLWESSVKSLKGHLKRATMNLTLSHQELDTVLIQIEGILNSRPLAVLSTDPNDPQPLTPSHFICGRAITAPPEPRVATGKPGFVANWQKVTELVQGFWNRLSLEHITSLQQRQKWKLSQPNIQVHDIVLIFDEQLPSMQWPLGIVKEVICGNDNKVRVVVVKTKNGLFKRGISKICKLPIE